MPRVLTSIGKILGVILIVLALAIGLIYFFVLQYPELDSNPTQDKWYRVSSPQMVCSDGSPYRALYKQGSAKRVLIYLAGGGVSINEETAAGDFYNKSEIGIDALANLTMNMGGIASDIEGSPFADWTVIAFPYATGDFHVGTGDFPYTDQDGQQRTLYHHGYTNFRTAMDLIRGRIDLGGTEAVVVTGYSAGGFGAALLAEDVFGSYFPDAASKTVLVDGALLTYDAWPDVAKNVWAAPAKITERLATDNIVLDSLTALRGTWGDTVNILFTCSTRDGDLAKVQNYLDDGIMEVDEAQADEFQQMLGGEVPLLREHANVRAFIWDDLPWYDDPRDLTQHTIIPTAAAFLPLGEAQISVAQWLADAVEGDLYDVGIELIS